MQVHVRFLGPIRRPRNGSSDLDVPEGATVHELLEMLGYEPEEARHVLVSRDGRAVRHDEPVREGDSLDLAMRIGGG